MPQRLPRGATISILVAVAATTVCGAWSAGAAEFTNPVHHYTLWYPDGWNFYVSSEGGSAGTVRFWNYPIEQHPHGSIVPMGGASISVQSFPPFSNPFLPAGMDDTSALEKMKNWHAVDITRSSGGNVSRLAYTLPNVDNTRAVNSVLHRGGKTFLILLRYRAEDTAGPSYEQQLDRLIASISVLTGTPQQTPSATRSTGGGQ